MWALVLFKQIAKYSDSDALLLRGLLARPGLRVFRESNVMVDRTCAACDCKLDVNPIKVKIGGKTVEVCCDECAQKLKEAHVSATAARKG
jgi:hypothetical protein